MSVNDFLSKYKLDIIQFIIENYSFQNNSSYWSGALKFKYEHRKKQKFFPRPAFPYLRFGEFTDIPFDDFFSNYVKSEKDRVYVNRYSVDRILKHNMMSVSELKEWKFVAWYDQMIDEHFSIDEITTLCKLVTVEWTEGLIEKYFDQIDFIALSQNAVLNFTNELLDRYSDRWDWFTISKNPQVYRCIGEDLLNKSLVDWNGISMNSGIHWTIDFYKQFGARVDFWIASRFTRVDWEIIKLHESQFQKNWISSSGYKRIDGTYEPINYYSNGLVSWCNNHRTRITMSDFSEIREVYVSTIENKKNMRDGWVESTRNSKLTSHMKESRILCDLSIENLAEMADYLPDQIFSHYVVAGHNHLYDNVIVPYLMHTDRRNQFFGITT